MHAPVILHLILVLALAFRQGGAALSKTISPRDDGALVREVGYVLEELGFELEWQKLEGGDGKARMNGPNNQNHNHGDPTKFLFQFWKDKAEGRFASSDGWSYCIRVPRIIRELINDMGPDACQIFLAEIPVYRIPRAGLNIYQKLSKKLDEKGHGKNSMKPGYLKWAL
ncbi:hypothetical protein F5Y06DRAFT_275523 [Hypoxylon sp. FL0890]|nr:hypothetical protein F5Y06DRAFT_275523 [Hypoxylon sp. FL0890]